MRLAGTAILLVSAVLVGCDRPNEHTKKPADHGVYHESENGPVRVGGALVSVNTAKQIEDSGGGYPILSVGLWIEYVPGALPTTIKGWAYDAEVMRELSGKRIEATQPEPWPVNFWATTDEGERLRGIMRSVRRVEPKLEFDVTVKAIRTAPSEVYGWNLSFERPRPAARRVVIDLDATDMGGTGRLRLSIPTAPS